MAYDQAAVHNMRALAQRGAMQAGATVNEMRALVGRRTYGVAESGLPGRHGPAAASRSVANPPPAHGTGSKQTPMGYDQAVVHNMRALAERGAMQASATVNEMRALDGRRTYGAAESGLPGRHGPAAASRSVVNPPPAHGTGSKQTPMGYDQAVVHNMRALAERGAIQASATVNEMRGLVGRRTYGAAAPRAGGVQAVDRRTD
jgi:hypothetical protein